MVVYWCYYNDNDVFNFNRMANLSCGCECMRLLECNYGTEVRIFSERPSGYKRYIVEWEDHTEIFNGMWYSLDKVKEIVEKRL